MGIYIYIYIVNKHEKKINKKERLPCVGFEPPTLLLMLGNNYQWILTLYQPA